MAHTVFFFGMAHRYADRHGILTASQDTAKQLANTSAAVTALSHRDSIVLMP